MAKRKSPPQALIEFGSEFRAEQALRRYRVAKLYLQGLTIRAIHKVLYDQFDCDVSVGTVWADVQAIQKDLLDLYRKHAAKAMSEGSVSSRMEIDKEPALCSPEQSSTIEIFEIGQLEG
jgi:transposase